MKKNIFQKINEVVKTKIFKIVVALVFLVTIFCMNFDFKRINKNKVSDAFSYIFRKKRAGNKNIVEIIDVKDDTMIYPKKEQSVKKKLIPDSEIRKDIQTEETLKVITNVFLKLKKVDENYEQRVKNKQINKNKKVKYGDCIYYAVQATFLDGDPKNNESRFYTLVKEGDSISDHLVGKRVGESVKMYYYDMYKNVSEEDKQKIKDGFDKAFKDINEKYGSKDKPVVDLEKIKYKVILLDFIPEKLVKELSLYND